MPGNYQILTPEQQARRAERRRRVRRWLIAAVGIVIVVAAVALAATRLASPPRPAGTDYSGTIDIGGQDRLYDVHLPPQYNPRQRWPLVLMFHGFLQTAEDARAITRFDVLADEQGFIVVYPQGFLRQWHYEPTQRSDVDDVAFAIALLERLADEVSFDPRRVYVAGFSQGGFFALRLACELSDRIAALGMVAGTMSPSQRDTCQPVRPVPVMMIHGDADPVVPYVSPNEAIVLGVADVIGHWLALNRCDPLPTETGSLDPIRDGTRVRYERYASCAQGAEVVLYTVEGGGHTWPGGPPPEDREAGAVSQDIDASAVLWEFFARHPLP